MIFRFDNIVSNYCGIRRPWIGSTDDPLYTQYKFNTGIDIFGEDVYAYASGVVVAVGKDADNLYAVSVQYSVNSILRYCHLKYSAVSVGDVVQQGFFIGEAHKYVHFEYANNITSMWPVRIGTETYYKQNPDTITYAKEIETQINGYTNKELSDGKGE